jgi:hypothetical protein
MNLFMCNTIIITYANQMDLELLVVVHHGINISSKQGKKK